MLCFFSSAPEGGKMYTTLIALQIQIHTETNRCLDILALETSQEIMTAIFTLMQEIVLRQKFHITTFYDSFLSIFSPQFFFVFFLQSRFKFFHKGLSYVSCNL